MVLTVLVLAYRQFIVFYQNLNNQPPAPMVIPAPNRQPQRHNQPNPLVPIAPQLHNPPAPHPPQQIRRSTRVRRIPQRLTYY